MYRLSQSQQAFLSALGGVLQDGLVGFGAYLKAFHGKDGRVEPSCSVDLQAKMGENQAGEAYFRSQTVSLSSRLLSRHFITRYTLRYASKMLPDEAVNQALDRGLLALGLLAMRWSRVSWLDNSAFSQSLSDQERQARAVEIANESRALAVLGGANNVLGLTGLLADSLWLLLVSLRCVFQLADLYQQPLTGVQGVKVAYEVLANAQLDALQDKQNLLLTLALCRQVIKNSEQDGEHLAEFAQLLHHHLPMQALIEELNSLAKQFDLSWMGLAKKMPSWTSKLVALGSVGTAAHYNYDFIESVIGVTQASFAPKPKLISSKSDLPDQD